jgi:acyl dehydratase
MTRFFEDFTVGSVEEFGRYDVTEAEILTFAERYDPQWFHTDPDRAREESMYGGLIASGWHTTAMMMRMLVDEFLSETASLGAKGVDELRWRRPVRPGDTLSLRLEVLSKESERPDRGLVESRIEVLRDADGAEDGEDERADDGDGGDAADADEDDAGEVVCSMVALTMFARRGDGEE